jgi:hypothetical protein
VFFISGPETVLRILFLAFAAFFHHSTPHVQATIVARIANPGTLSERISNPRYDEAAINHQPSTINHQPSTIPPVPVDNSKALHRQSQPHAT